MLDSVPIRELLAPARHPGKPWTTILLLVAASLPTYASARLSRFRPIAISSVATAWHSLVTLSPSVRMIEWRGALEPLRLPTAVEAATPRPEELAAPVVLAGLRLAAVQSGTRAGGNGDTLTTGKGRSRPSMPGREIEDGGGVAMASFYAALARTLAGEPGAVTRILHFGDSPVTGDLISSGARTALQTRYGDAGHGFIFVGRPWEWYNHHGVELSSSGWRMLSPLFRAGNEGCYGLGGVCFEGGSDSAHCQVGTVARGLGSQVARFDVHLQVRPGGGTVLASIDDGPPEELATAGPERIVSVRSLQVPDGPHTLTLRPKGDGEVVLFGVALERPGPGVVYDSLGTNGGTVHFLTLIDEKCWRDELRERAPNLVILNYGTNESGYGYFSFEAYAEDIRRVIRRIREAVPGASILLMSPMDRGTMDESGDIVTMPTIPKIVDTQRAVAAEMGCAYFDTFRAMGGEGTMGRWYRGNTHLVTGDLTHPTGVGADLVAGLLVDALEAGFGSRTSGTTAAHTSASLNDAPKPPVAGADKAAGGSPETSDPASTVTPQAAATPRPTGASQGTTTAQAADTARATPSAVPAATHPPTVLPGPPATPQ